MDIRVQPQVDLQAHWFLRGEDRVKHWRQRLTLVAEHLVGFELVPRSFKWPHYHRIGSH